MPGRPSVNVVHADLPRRLSEEELSAWADKVVKEGRLVGYPLRLKGKAQIYGAVRGAWVTVDMELGLKHVTAVFDYKPGRGGAQAIGEVLLCVESTIRMIFNEPVTLHITLNGFDGSYPGGR